MEAEFRAAVVLQMREEAALLPSDGPLTVWLPVRCGGRQEETPPAVLLISLNPTLYHPFIPMPYPNLAASHAGLIPTSTVVGLVSSWPRGILSPYVAEASIRVFLD